MVIVLGLLGLIIGSFLNVVILRKGIRALDGRSSCMSCGEQLAWHDMIPVVSWVLLRGKCRKCGSGISAQYPIVEASTAILFGVLGGAGLPFLWLILSLGVVSLLVVIATYDILHTIIPDEWAYLFAALAFVSALLTMHPSVLMLLAGPFAALPLFMLWLVSGGKWMGLGDAKLALGIGWLLGFPTGLVAVMASFVIGTVLLIPWMFTLRLLTHMTSVGVAAAGLTMKSEVPFGPFLIIACLIFWVSGLYGFSPLAFLGW